MSDFSEEVFIIHYLYKISCFKEFISDSYEVFCNLKKGEAMNFEEFKKKFDDKNKENYNRLKEHNSSLSLFPNTDTNINDKIKRIMIKKIKNELYVDLEQNIEIGKINIDNFSERKDIFENSFFSQLIAEKLISYILEINFSFNSILQMFDKKYYQSVEQLLKENKKKKEENLKLNELIQININEIKELKNKIDSNKREYEEKINNVKEIMNSNKIEYEKKINLNKSEYELKIQNMVEKINSNESEYELKIQNMKEQMNTNKSEYELKIQNMKEQMNTHESEYELKIQNMKEQMNTNKSEYELKIQNMKEQMNSNKSEYELKIKNIEEKVKKSESIIEKNKKEADLKYNELNEKFFKIFKAYLTNSIISKENQRIFDEYKKKINIMNEKNNELTRLNDIFRIELDKKNIEIKELKNFLENVKF